MKLAEKFGLPVFSFVDTPGAYPGIGAEERGQSEAIGRNIFEMAQLEVPIIVTIIGEGGSGGALAISVGDQLLMLQYSIYSVISPEGCASILWKTAERARRGGRAARHHGASPEGARPGRQDRQRAGRRRAPRPEADGRVPEARPQRRLPPGQRHAGEGARAAPLRPAAVLRPIQRHDRALTTASRGASSPSPSAAGAIRPRCSTRRSPQAAPLGVVGARASRPPWPERERRRLARSRERRSAHAGHGAACRSSWSRRRLADASGAGRERRGVGAPVPLSRPARDGARARRRPRPPRPPSARPGRDLPAPGAARRRRRGAFGDAEGRPSRRRHLGASVDRAVARGDRGLCAAPPPALDRRRQQRRRPLRAQSPAPPRLAGARRSLRRCRGRRWPTQRERVQDAAAVVDEIAAARPRRDRRRRAASIWRPGAHSSGARRRQALLRWLRIALGEAPPATLVERLMGEALASGPQRRWPIGSRRAAQLSRPAAQAVASAVCIDREAEPRWST